MLNIRLRKKMLYKIAQETGNENLFDIPEAGQDDTATTETATALSPAPEFIASLKYVNIQEAFPTSYSKINAISAMLNQILHVITKGKYNLQKLYTSNFADSFTAETGNSKFLLNFAKELYNQLYKVPAKPIKKQQFTQIINSLLSSPNLNGLSTTNLTGPMAAQLNVGDIKANILGELNNLRNMAPTE